MKAVIVTGSRNWTDEEAIAKALEASKPDIVIHGNARGADSIAHKLSAGRREIIPMPAQWHRDGKRAGPFRNARMLAVLLALRECGYDVEVLAFPLPDSIGTPHMIGLAVDAGVSVIGDFYS